MASRKSRTRPFGSLRRKRRSALPILENLEERIVLSQALPPNLVGNSSASPLSPHGGLVPYTLANGGTGWLLMPGATGELATQGRTPLPATDPAGSTPSSIPACHHGQPPGRLAADPRRAAAIARAGRLHPDPDPDRLRAEQQRRL